MNKIVLDEDYYKLENEEIDLKITKKNTTLEITGNVVINDFDTVEDINLKIVLNDNSSLIYNKYNKDITYTNILIDVNNNTNLEFNQSVYSTLESNHKIKANILGNNNNTTINFYGVSNIKGKILVEATGDVKKNINNNEMLENIRILTLNEEENIIYPNLLVSSDEVSINHNATISGLDEDYLFYLESKGLSKKEATKLITKGFILNKLKISDEYKDKIFI